MFHPNFYCCLSVWQAQPSMGWSSPGLSRSTCGRCSVWGCVPWPALLTATAWGAQHELELAQKRAAEGWKNFLVTLVFGEGDFLCWGPRDRSGSQLW